MKMFQKEKRRRIGELLVEAGLISAAQLDEALNQQQAHGGKVVENLIALGFMDAKTFVDFLAHQPGIPSIDLANYEVSAKLVSVLPKELAQRHEVFPIDKLGKLLTVGMVCPLDAQAIQEIQEVTGLKIQPLLCSPDAIRSAIKRYYPSDEDAQEAANHEDLEGPIADLEGPLKLRSVIGLIRQIKSLPALPNTVQRVRKAMANPLVSTHEVAGIILLDPPVAAKVLSVANSAAYGFANRVDTVQLAVTLLGLRETCTIVTSVAVLNLFDQSQKFNYRSFWLESVCCAEAAQAVAKACRHTEQPGIVSAALLHDIGRIALIEVVPDLYSKVGVETDGPELIAAEERVVGLTHMEAGHELARHWGLPDDIAETIRFHHTPEHATQARETVALVSIAEALTRENGLGEQPGLLDSCARAFEILNTDKETVAAVIQAVGEIEQNRFHWSKRWNHLKGGPEKA